MHKFNIYKQKASTQTTQTLKKNGNQKKIAMKYNIERNDTNFILSILYLKMVAIGNVINIAFLFKEVLYNL